MFFSYVLGGFIPLLSYLIFPIKIALPISIVTTLLGLFGLGIFTSHFTKDNWIKAGLRIFILGGIALSVGLVVGNLFKS